MACADCIVHQIGSAEFLDQLARAPDAPEKLPLAGSIELSLRCNMRCKHCYILYPGATDGEMSTEDAKAAISKLADAGVLFLLMTGGEIFARRDFKELYLHAKKRGMLVTLFTNATLVTEELALFLKEWPPRRIEITVYGHTAETYEAVTGTRRSFERFRRGVDILLSHELPVYLKTIVLKTNAHEYQSIKTWAEGLGVPFRDDAMVNPKLDGDMSPTLERLSPKEVIQVQGTGENAKSEYLRLREKTENAPADTRLFKCGAGIKTFHVDPAGNVHPCMMWRSSPYNILSGSVEGWKEHITELRSREIPVESHCTSCNDRLACMNCPATSYLEAGKAGMHLDYYCDIAEKRASLFGQKKLELNLSQSE